MNQIEALSFDPRADDLREVFLESYNLSLARQHSVLHEWEDEEQRQEIAKQYPELARAFERHTGTELEATIALTATGSAVAASILFAAQQGYNLPQ